MNAAEWNPEDCTTWCKGTRHSHIDRACWDEGQIVVLTLEDGFPRDFQPDKDREFESDLAYMRDLVTELHVHGSVEHLTQVVTAPSPEYDIDLYLEPWPTGMDLAGDMLAAWRAGTTDLDIYAIGQSS